MRTKFELKNSNIKKVEMSENQNIEYKQSWHDDY